jgi:hypothetical protein
VQQFLCVRLNIDADEWEPTLHPLL